MMKPDEALTANKVKVNDSFLINNKEVAIIEPETLAKDEINDAEFVRLNSLNSNQKGLKLEIDLSKQFGSQQQFQVSVNELPLNDFLHYVLGELLDVSYLIEPSVKSNVSPVTLELKDKVSAQRLFQLVQQILSQNNVTVAFSDELFYVHPLAKKANKSSKAFGFGREVSDVPNVSGDIIQLVPLKFGTNRGLKTTIGALVDAKVNLDSSQGLMTIVGKREQILRTLSLVHLLDSAGINNKAIALLSFSYIDSQTFIEKVTELLAQEGILTKRDLNNSVTVKFIPIEHLGKVVVFASADEILTRIEYWTKQLDKPASGSEQSFYTYHPRYARAADLGESLAPLLGGNSNRSGFNRNQSGISTSNTGNASNSQNKQRAGQKSNANGVQTIEGDNIRLVVDERSNALIFYSTGKFYQELLPIIKKLDVMPKQVMLEVVIAEVKLTGSFAKGVEFAIKSGTSGNTQKSFSYSGQDGFGYSMVGLSGNLNINLNQKDGLINVLSRPTLLVRDGVSASISVGDDVPTVGSTTSDPINGERETTTIQYRKTGIDLTVTPTINAQGTVIMSIEQNISNISPDGVDVSGSPSIFERKISTEVVAGDGQSVLLGGLISENKSSNANVIPILGTLPIVGHLFRSDADNSDKTELVILVTPKIIHNASDWGRIQQSFIEGLDNIHFN
ncbi:MAG: type II secretory pathway protein [Colwellia sp.]|nr:type II secretory pathway protein [Colwellia sp.]